jgi:hypothetical protein
MSASKATATQPAARQQPASSTVSASPQAGALAGRLGNHYLQMFLHARLLQAKLTVSDPQDPFEREADRVAEYVMRMPESAPPVAGRSEPAVQRFGAPTAGGSAVDPVTEQAIGSLFGRGAPLPTSVRAFMEPRFNTDFQAVRVHDDPEAHALARAVSAQAFTVGRNIVFGAGHYSPNTDAGRRLLAHELTHTVQQGATSSHVARAPQSAPPTGREAPPEKIPYEYTPIFLHGTASTLAREAATILRKGGIQHGTLDRFTLLVVTDRVYIYSASGELRKKSFALTTAPPVHGLYMGKPRDLARYRYVRIKGAVAALNWFGHWAPGEWVTDWSAMTAADVTEAIGDSVPVLIVGGDGTTASAMSPDGTGGGGGTSHSSNAAAHTVPSKVTTPDSTSKKAAELRQPLSGSEYEKAEGEIANYPAFPAEIKASS